MLDLIRDAPLGQLVRWFTKNHFLQYPEERDDFSIPEKYSKASKTISTFSSESATPDKFQSISPISNKTIAASSQNLILVDWYTDHDPANPQNWTKTKKAIVGTIIILYTFIVYTGSAIYTASEEGVSTEFNVSTTAASLGLALYVLAYGIGPLLFSPLSEIPVIGRTSVYIITMLLFVVLSIPLPMIHNFAGLLVLRFLQGFFGSPCLATGGATMGDMYSFRYLPFALSAWVAAAYCGPALGPLLAGYAVTEEGWRWSLWEILWGSAPVFVMMLFLPETSSATILLRRAKHLRKVTGCDYLMSKSEIESSKLKTSAVLVDALIKPMEITIKDPAILFVQVYTAIVYGIYYSFFEAFPLVYPPMYGFTLGTIGLAFLCILVACILGIASYFLYLHFYLLPDLSKHFSNQKPQESRLLPALFGCFGPPIGLFLFAWSANPSIHWIVPTIGIVIFSGSAFVVLQCVFVYVSLSYPRYAASLFAGNDFFRSAMACGSILYGRPMFLDLGVGRGVSLLGGLSTLGVIGIFLLYQFGAKLRAKSKFAVS